MVHFTIPPMLQELFSQLTFPKSKAELVAFAKERGFSDDALIGLESMPDHVFNSLEEFMMSWGFRSEFQADAAVTSHTRPGAVAAEGADDDAELSDAENEETEGEGDMLAPIAAPNAA